MQHTNTAKNTDGQHRQAPHWLTADEMAQRLRVNHMTLRKLAWAGRIPYVRVGSKVLRFDPVEVEAALAGH